MHLGVIAHLALHHKTQKSFAKNCNSSMTHLALYTPWFYWALIFFLNKGLKFELPKTVISAYVTELQNVNKIGW